MKYSWRSSPNATEFGRLREQRLNLEEEQLGPYRMGFCGQFDKILRYPPLRRKLNRLRIPSQRHLTRRHRQAPPWFGTWFLKLFAAPGLRKSDLEKSAAQCETRLHKAPAQRPA